MAGFQHKHSHLHTHVPVLVFKTESVKDGQTDKHTDLMDNVNPLKRWFPTVHKTYSIQVFPLS